MKLFSLMIFATMGSTFAFNGSPTSTKTTKPQPSNFEFYGDIEPTGFFDPLQVTANADDKTLQYMREAELHHGRIAMTSVIILPVLDKLYPDELAINALSHSGSGLNEAALASMGLFELSRMTSLYKAPRERLFELKDNAQPGQLNPYYKLNVVQANKELSNGRLAMIGVFLYMLQEFTTNQKVLF